jgi:sigma-B regulation protein RsbU (phosphoserine phosphatase)
MRDSLKTHIEQLRETTARQQKLESEIQIASDIQMSMVPGGGTVLINELNYQLYATLRSARSVGGDLYYFQQDGNKLHFIIGDVSDKGVPAALFMAKNDDLSPGDTFTHMNHALTQNNEACMFVTALCGTLDLDSGELVMANAGHMHPIQKTRSGSGELVIDGGIALGLMEDVEYPNVIHKLPPQTSLLMYTDGISEAFNPAREQYGEERLLAFVAQAKKLAADDLANAVIPDVEKFVADAEQSDDITLMVIHYGS